MAYGLKYYKELTQPNGKVVRLEILEKGYEGASKEIGPVCQALRLDIQGDTEIDAPIVKTSLSMTFVDAPDHADARTQKCGNWDEFYTSDATLWRVVLKARNAQETAFNTIWGGYITPDSYTEVLQYRGSVTLVARDNIGHLSDFPFDAEGNADGMISLIELIRGAWDKIESPMTLDDQAVANADWMLSDGVYAYDTYMNVSAFEDMNWYDALESALYAYGLVLRYTGNNNVSFYSLRNLPRMGAHEVEDISFIEPTFMSGAERELTPAVKRIEEAVDYEIIEQKAAPLIESVTFTGSSSTIPFESKNILGEKEWKDIPTWPIDNTTNEGWGNDKNKTLFYSPKAYGYDSVVGGNELYLATNTDGSGSVWYGLHMQGKSFKFTLAFGQLIERVNVPLYLSPIIVKKVDVIVSASANGITSYLNAGGSWQTSEAVLSLSIDEETSAVTKVVPLGAFSLDETLVKVTIKNVSLGARAGEEWWDVSRGNGIYVAINALTFADNNGEALCETNRVNTNYDAKNNIILSRDPKIAPALNDVLFPSIIKNGIFVKEGRTYNPAKTWYWGGHTPQQMAVYNHLQLLCYHAKPNNILRGTIVNADVADMQVIWMWHGAEHMLVSGTLDLISGYIENAVLREFARYEDMWGMLEPADMPEVEGNSTTNVEGGVAASSEGARMTSTTTVNIGGGGGSIVLDTFMSDTSQNGVQNRVIKAYVDNLWHLDENGNLVTDKQVLIKNNLIVEQDTSSGGEGESVLVGVQGISVNGGAVVYPNSEGIVELTISGGGGTADLSNYYTKSQSDARYLALSGGEINGSGYIPFSIKSNDRDAVGIRFIGYDGRNGHLLYGGDSTYLVTDNGWHNAYTLIHSGNIGSQSVASAKSLVASDGTTYVSYNSTYGQVNVKGINIGYGGNTIETASGGVLNIQANSTGGTIISPYGGNVGIGTDSPSYKLDVYGDSRINGNLVVSGDTSSGSDIRFKDIIDNKTIKVEDIANAPLFTFKWNNRDDDTVHMGSSAQYWENIAPWLVSGSEFKSLNYATLGVAMGISLAKKAVNHEERIKVLEKEIKRLKEEMIHG